MCFSATSSFVVASALIVTGAIALKNTKHKNLISLALIPFGFAAQQAAEGVVWLTLDQPESMVHKIATYSFLTFAFMVWPLWIPSAVKAFELYSTEKILLTLCQLIGLLFGITALFFMWAIPISTSDATGNIAYYLENDFFKEPAFLAWYVLPTILPFLLIYNRILGTMIGSFAVISLAATYLVLPEGLISVWCFLAALISVVVIGIIWDQKK